MSRDTNGNGLHGFASLQRHCIVYNIVYRRVESRWKGHTEDENRESKKKDPFLYTGNQVHLEVSGKDFYLDLLFYHVKLRCYVVIDLKSGDFIPEYAGKMNFYLSAVDNLLRHKDDQKSIGIILCKNKDRVIVEYALQDTKKPIGVSSYQLTQALPLELKTNLPSVGELEKELEKHREEKE